MNICDAIYNDVLMPKLASLAQPKQPDHLPDAGNMIEQPAPSSRVFAGLLAAARAEVERLKGERDNYKARFEDQHMSQMNTLVGGRHTDGSAAW